MSINPTMEIEIFNEFINFLSDLELVLAEEDPNGPWTSLMEKA